MEDFKIGDVVKIKGTEAKGLVVELWKDSKYNSFLGVAPINNVFDAITSKNAVPLPEALFEKAEDKKAEEETQPIVEPAKQIETIIDGDLPL